MSVQSFMYCSKLKNNPMPQADTHTHTHIYVYIYWHLHALDLSSLVLRSCVRKSTEDADAAQELGSLGSKTTYVSQYLSTYMKT